MTSCTICHGKTELSYKDLFDDRYGSPGKYRIYKCKSCGFGRTMPLLNKHKIGKFYSQYYPLLSTDTVALKKNTNIPSPLKRWFNGNDNTAHYHIKPHTVVLDIGSGSGLSLLEIEKLGSKAYGVEPDPNAQKIAEIFNLTVHQGFITDNPFPKIKFDYITASQVLEHDPNPKSFLLAAKNKLADNGTIILGFPNIDAFYRNIFGNKWLHWHVPYHLNFFTKKSLKILTQQTGLKTIQIKTITPNLWTILQLRMLFTIKEEGKANPIWVSQYKKKKNINIDNNLFNRMIYASIVNITGLTLGMLNRIIDLIGYGESFLIVLKRNDE